MNGRMRARRLLALVLLLVAGAAYADIRFRTFVDDDEPKWQEDEDVALPAFPNESNLAEYYVSAVATNRYFVDTASIAMGGDGVVRYALVVRTAGGATNVTFEGLRCDSMQYKIYATGRTDAQWARARRVEWRPVENKPVNRHHAALSRDYFCPEGNRLGSAAEGVEALRLGKHPRAK